MAVTARSLRRRNLRSNPAAVKVGAGILAGVVGMSTAAFGVLQMVHPYKGNGARSEPRAAQEESSSPTTDLVASILGLTTTESPSSNSSGDEFALSISGTDTIVTSVVDSVQGSPNGSTSPTPGGGGSGSPNKPTLVPTLGGGNGGGPGRDEGSKGLNTPSVNVTPPVLPLTPMECPTAPAELTPAFLAPAPEPEPEPAAESADEAGTTDETEDPCAPDAEAPSEDQTEATAPTAA